MRLKSTRWLSRTRRRHSHLWISLLFFSVFPFGSVSGSDVLVVCPTRFENALQEWVQYRRQQGVGVQLVDSNASADQLSATIRSAKPRPGYVLLVGDAPAIGKAAVPAQHVPVHYVATTVTAKFGSTPTLATDAPYGDFNQDGVVDAAVGRLPVDTPDQLSAMIRRIKAYESSRDFSLWRDRVQLVGGVGGFGMLADAAIESVTRLMVTASLPTNVRTSVAYGSPGHLFYPAKRFTSAITQRYNQGCRFWVYAGHGMVEQLDRVPAGSSGVPVLDRNSVGGLSIDAQRSPIALLLCCYTGAIDAGVDSFSETMLLHEGGPIAVIAGSRVTMPYGNATLTLGMINSIHPQDEDRIPAERLGDAWQSSLQQLRTEPSADQSGLQSMLNGVAALVSPAGTKLADERSEHSQLYFLFGDPLLKLLPPKKIRIATETGFDYQKPVKIKVTCPIGGRCTVMLDHPLGETYTPKGDDTNRDPNELTLATEEREIAADQPEQFTITVPPGRSGLVSIRVHVAGKESWASGGATTIIRPAQ